MGQAYELEVTDSREIYCIGVTNRWGAKGISTQLSGIYIGRTVEAGSIRHGNVAVMGYSRL
jgi:hypothetical protein